MKLLGSNLTGFIFEQEYQRKENRTPGNQMAHDLDKFLQMIPKDNCYHLELPKVVCSANTRPELPKERERLGKADLAEHQGFRP